VSDHPKEVKSKTERKRDSCTISPARSERAPAAFPKTFVYSCYPFEQPDHPPRNIDIKSALFVDFACSLVPGRMEIYILKFWSILSLKNKSHFIKKIYKITKIFFYKL